MLPTFFVAACLVGATMPDLDPALTDDIIEVAARADFEHTLLSTDTETWDSITDDDRDSFRDVQRAVLAVVVPLLRAHEGVAIREMLLATGYVDAAHVVHGYISANANAARVAPGGDQ
jgi:hypothetical protein